MGSGRVMFTKDGQVVPEVSKWKKKGEGKEEGQETSSKNHLAQKLTQSFIEMFLVVNRVERKKHMHIDLRA